MPHPPQNPMPQPPSHPLPPLQPPPSIPSHAPGRAPGPRGGRRKAWVIGLLLLLLLAGGGAYAVWAGHEGDAEPSAAHAPSAVAAGAQAWKKAARTEPSPSAKHASGTWFTRSTVVKAEPDMMTAYDLKTGTKQWSLVLDGVLCAASRDADADRVLIALKKSGTCDAMTVIDIRRGSRLYSQPIALHTIGDPDLDNFRPDKWQVEMEVAVSGGHGLITWATGAKVIRLGDGKTVGESPEKECRIVGAAGGAHLLTQRRCGQRTTVRSQNPDAFDRPRWTWEGREGEDVAGVISTSPVVLLISVGQARPLQVVALDGDGKERSRIELRRDHETSACSSGMSKCPEYLVDGDTVYVARKGSTTAHDLANGREKWTYKADANRTAFPVAVQGGQLAVYVAGTPERVGELSRVSARTGEAVRTTRLADDLRTTEWRLARKGAVAHLKEGLLLLVNEGVLDSVDTDVVVAVAAP
ncbi:PQQ-binding-like beta-propeller repeat protein [Streptomyces sp. NPDC026206]|uniref:outer membrane protein assembly factor BamB family protein n=1 Tax=Streptomyces sp. NPDC026206 TaxID=3157089 RepID=UPI0033E26FD1